MSYALQRTVSKALPVSANGLQSPSVGLSKALACVKMDDEPTYVKVPIQSAAAPPPPPSLQSDGKSSGGKDSKTDPPSGSSEDIAKVIAIYRSRLTSGGGSGGGFRYKHSQGQIVNLALSSTPTQSPPAWEISSGVNVLSLNSVEQGDTVYSRTSNSIKQHHITIRFNIDYTVSSASAADLNMYPVRVIVFWDKMPALNNFGAGAATSLAIQSFNSLNFASVLQSFAAPVGGQNQLTTISPYNYNTHGFRYDIIHDKIYNAKSPFFCAQTGGSPFALSNNTHEIYIPLKDRISTTPSLNANMPDTNALFVYFATDTDSATSNVPTLCATYDLCFTDADN